MKNPSQPLYQPDDSHSHNKGTNPNSPSLNLQVRMQDEASAKGLSPRGAAPEAETKSCAEIASSLSEFPTPLSLLPPVKNSPSLSPPVKDVTQTPSPELLANRRFFLFEKKVHRILKDLSGCFKLLQGEINHLDRNDFLAANLNPAMGQVSDTIHQMEQLCVNQNPAFIPAKDPGPRENTLSETQQKSDQEASDEYFKPKPQPPMETTKEYKRDRSPSETPHRRKPHKPPLEILSSENRESTPYPQLRNLPPELLDYTNVRFFSKETDASKPENKMSPRMKSYMAMIKRIYDEKDERDRKAAEAKAQWQPSNPNPDSEDARNAA